MVNIGVGSKILDEFRFDCKYMRSHNFHFISISINFLN